MSTRIPIAQLLKESQGLGVRLRTDLAVMRRTWGEAPGLTYRGPADFVLRHGTLKRGVQLPAGEPPGQERACYYNALLGSLRHGWAYVEGFAAHPAVRGDEGLAVPVAHAWNEDAEGHTLDLTWRWGHHLDEWASLGWYMGVPFTAARAHDCTWNGDGAVLHDPKRGWGVLARPWIAEESPGELAGLVAVIATDMKREGGEFARLAVELERRARAEGWPAA
jgi:hypothetical protein